MCKQNISSSLSLSAAPEDPIDHEPTLFESRHPARSQFIVLLPLLLAGSARAAFEERAQSGGSSPAPVPMDRLPVLDRAIDLGPAQRDQILELTVSLRFARLGEIESFLDRISRPDSPDYRRFLTPEQVGAQFGVPQDDVDAVTCYLQENGMSLGLVCKNRLAILARATVAQAESAFHTSIHEYSIAPEDEFEPARFIACAAPVRLPAPLAQVVIDVSGLETHTRPRPRTTLLTPSLTALLYDTAHMQSVGFHGEGRSIGVSNWDGFRAADYIAYVNHFGLPTPPTGPGSNVVVVPCQGGGSGAGSAAGEGDLDIQMELGTAPLATIRVYDGNPQFDLTGVLAVESNENLADVISECYSWDIPSNLASAAHNLHLSLSAQGITYLAASGDRGTVIDPFNYPHCDPEVLSVGGTVADVDSTTGARTSEFGWGGSGGGWSDSGLRFNVRPSWQTGTGVPPTPDRRLFPDVAFHSAGNGTGAYPFYTGGVLHGNYDGTSFASPMFAGCLGVIEQRIIASGGLLPDAAGKRRFGRMQDLIYAENGRSDIWYDIVVGSNGLLPNGNLSTCTAGWDTVTGWGPMDCEAFANAERCRGGCNTGNSFCAGDGTDPFVSVSCPCSNFGQIGHGCANSVDASGALLSAAGTPSLDDVVFSVSGLPAGSAVVFMQSATQNVGGLLYGDGIRCLSRSVRRLYTKTAVGTGASAPEFGDPSVRTRSAALGDPIGSYSTRYYQVYYPDQAANFCPPGRSNISNGYAILWP
jgi:hypothetical protein